MATSTPPTHNRLNLFLVRLWPGNDKNAASEKAGIEWCGKVQRVVNGEAHSFSNWQELVDILKTMVASNDHQHDQQL